MVALPSGIAILVLLLMFNLSNLKTVVNANVTCKLYFARKLECNTCLKYEVTHFLGGNGPKKKERKAKAKAREQVFKHCHSGQGNNLSRSC